MRHFGTLALGVALAVVAITLQWFGAGGLQQRLPVEDPRVSAAWQYVISSRAAPRAVERCQLQKAWLVPKGHGYLVNIGVKESSKYSYRYSVVFDENSTPVSVDADFWAGSMFPRYLRLMSASVLAIWFARSFIAPHFAVKCPDCPPSLVNPPVAVLKETVVYPGGFDAEGYSLAPIVRKDYVCPRCRYIKTTYVVPGEYRPARAWKTAFYASGARFERIVSPQGYVGELDWYQKVLDNWHARNPKITRFKTYDEWKAYWDELKASEHEERI